MKDGHGSEDRSGNIFTYKTRSYSNQKVAMSEEFYLSDQGQVVAEPDQADFFTLP